MAIGKKTGGRIKGGLNRATAIIKEAIAEKLTNIEPESFLKMSELARAMHGVAAKELAKAVAAEAAGSKYDLRLPMQLMEAAQRAWDRVCQYERPRMAAMQFSVAPVDFSKLRDDDLHQLARIIEAATPQPVGRDTGRAGPTAH